jgi:hypothetical protein
MSYDPTPGYRRLASRRRHKIPNKLKTSTGTPIEPLKGEATSSDTFFMENAITFYPAPEVIIKIQSPGIFWISFTYLFMCLLRFLDNLNILSYLRHICYPLTKPYTTSVVITEVLYIFSLLFTLHNFIVLLGVSFTFAWYIVQCSVWLSSHDRGETSPSHLSRHTVYVPLHASLLAIREQPDSRPRQAM